jgi:hypothetical protein
MRKYRWSGWSDWKSLAALRDGKFRDISEEPGTYAIAATNLEIHRVLGTDTNGMLYVGETGKWLRWRMKAFCDCVEYAKDTHVAGWRYNLVGLKTCAPPASLRFRWFTAPDKESARRVECELLYAYVTEHCELPPLNYSLGRSLMVDLGWQLKRKKA